MECAFKLTCNPSKHIDIKKTLYLQIHPEVYWPTSKCQIISPWLLALQWGSFVLFYFSIAMWLRHKTPLPHSSKGDMVTFVSGVPWKDQSNLVFSWDDSMWIWEKWEKITRKRKWNNNKQIFQLHQGSISFLTWYAPFASPIMLMHKAMRSGNDSLA